MGLSELKEILKKDFYRYYGYYPKNIWIKGITGNEGFRFNFTFRLSQFLKNKKSLLRFFISYIRKVQARKNKVSVPKSMNVGPGFCLFHLYCLNIASNIKIGSNFTIMHQVTIGYVNHGKLKGAPQIGDNVFIGPGAVLIGKINIGDNVLISGNSFVNQDIPSDSIVYGNPCIIKSSKKATEGYILNRV